jgi:hypothetical protein
VCSVLGEPPWLLNLRRRPNGQRSASTPGPNEAVCEAALQQHQQMQAEAIALGESAAEVADDYPDVDPSSCIVHTLRDEPGAGFEYLASFERASGSGPKVRVPLDE